MSQRKINELPSADPKTTDFIAFAGPDGIAKRVDIKRFLETGMDEGGSTRAPVFLSPPVAKRSDLPAVGISGQLIVCLEDKSIYGWDEITQSYINGGNIQGPAGDTLRISSSVNSADLLDPRPALLTVTLTTSDKSLWIYSPSDSSAYPGPASPAIAEVPNPVPGMPPLHPAHPAQPPAGWCFLGRIDGPVGPQGPKGDPGLEKGTIEGQILRWSVSSDRWVGGAAPVVTPGGIADGNTITWNQALNRYDSVPFPKQLEDGTTDGQILTWDTANVAWVTTDNQLLNQTNITGITDPSADGGTLVFDQINQMWDVRPLFTSDLADVTALTQPSDGDALVWSDADGVYVPRTIQLPTTTRFRNAVENESDLASIPDPQYGDVAVTRADGYLHVFSEATDDWDIIGPVASTLPKGSANNDSLLWNAANQDWEAGKLPPQLPSAVTNGDLVKFDGTKWIGAKLTIGDLTNVGSGPYTSGSVLSYTTSSNTWEATQLKFSNLSDYDTTTPPVGGQTLLYDSKVSEWVPSWLKVSGLSDVVQAAGHALTVGDTLTWRGTRWEIDQPAVTKAYVDGKLSSVLTLKPGVTDKVALDALDVTKNAVGDTRFTSDGQMWIWNSSNLWEATGKASVVIPTGTNQDDTLSWDTATSAWLAKQPTSGKSLLANLLDVQMSYTDTRHPGGLPNEGQTLIWTTRSHNTDPGAPTTGAWRPGFPNPQLKEWNGTKLYNESDVVYHKGRLWTATHISKRNVNIEPDLTDGESVAIWTNNRGVGSGPRLIERVNNVADINVPPANLTLPAGVGAFSRTVYLQYGGSDTNWSLWEWNSTVVSGAWVWGWTRIDTSGGSQVWRNVALPTPSAAPSSVTLWIYGLQNHTHAPIASVAGWQPIALGDFLVSMADVVAANANNGDVLISDGAGRWYARANPGYTKAEVDNKINTLVLGLEHGEAVQAILNDPPTTPTADEFYIVDSAPTGAWAGHTNSVTWWNGTAWQFQTPQQNEAHLVESTDSIVHFNGTTWVKVANANAGSTAASGVGEIIPWVSDTVPADYLPCDGRIVSIAAYADLHAVLKNKYNAGTGADGTSTFALPDLRDYFVRGISSSGTPAIGTKHDWTTGRPRSNFTTDNPGNHSHGFTNGDQPVCTSIGGHDLSPAGGGNQEGYRIFRSDGAHTHTITGGGDTETAPKHFTVMWVIRTKAINGGARGPQGTPGVGMPAATTNGQIPVYNGTTWGAQSTTSILAPITYTKSEADGKFAPIGTSDGISQKYKVWGWSTGKGGMWFGGTNPEPPGQFIEMEGNIQPSGNSVLVLKLEFDNNEFVFDPTTVDCYSVLERWSNDGDKRTGAAHVSQAGCKGVLLVNVGSRYLKGNNPARLRVMATKDINFWLITWHLYRLSDNDTPMTDDGSLTIHTTNSSNKMTFFGVNCLNGSSNAEQSMLGKFMFKWK